MNRKGVGKMILGKSLEKIFHEHDEQVRKYAEQNRFVHTKPLDQNELVSTFSSDSILRKKEKLDRQAYENNEEFDCQGLENEIERQLILKVQLQNLTGSKDYFDISKLHAKASFIISVIACFIGLGLLTVAAVFTIREQDFRVGIMPAIGGAVANFIAATVFWVHNKSAQQLNLY